MIVSSRYVAVRPNAGFPFRIHWCSGLPHYVRLNSSNLCWIRRAADPLTPRYRWEIKALDWFATKKNLKLWSRDALGYQGSGIIELPAKCLAFLLTFLCRWIWEQAENYTLLLNLEGHYMKLENANDGLARSLNVFLEHLAISKVCDFWSTDWILKQYSTYFPCIYVFYFILLHFIFIIIFQRESVYKWPN